MPAIPPSRGGARAAPKIAFIGAGSTVFTKNLVGDILQRPALAGATLALMDIDAGRLAESEIVVGKIIASLGVPARVETTLERRRALEGADFVVAAFQIGGYEPCTVTDFEVPRAFGLRQTIGDTLGVGGIMRALRTVPHLWAICEDMTELCPDAILLQYVNPMAINTWAIAEKYPAIRQVGLCHSVQHTVMELAHDLDLAPADIRYEAAGINHMAFFTRLERRGPGGGFTDLYPALKAGYASGRLPKPPLLHQRCPNKARYEMMMRLGYFVTESSEHFAEYVPYFIKDGREDLVERFGIPLDEYPKRCIEQAAAWRAQAEAFRSADRIAVEDSGEYASSIVNSVVTGEPSVIYGNLRKPRLHCAAARGLRRRAAVPRRRERHPADPRRAAAPTAHGAHAHQCQRAGAYRRGADDGERGARLPRRHARPAHRRRARSRPDLGDDGAAPRGTRRLATGMGAAGTGRGGGVEGKGPLPGCGAGKCPNLRTSPVLGPALSLSAIPRPDRGSLGPGGGSARTGLA